MYMEVYSYVYIEVYSYGSSLLANEIETPDPNIEYNTILKYDIKCWPTKSECVHICI